MKYVLDTDVIVAGLLSPTGASKRLLILLDEGRFEAIVNPAMMFEYEAVLKRPQNLQAARLTSQQVDTFLDTLAEVAIHTPTFFQWRPALRDSDDEHILEAAMNGGADAIVTFNTRHYRLVSDHFRLRVMKPSEALRNIEGWQR